LVVCKYVDSSRLSTASEMQCWSDEQFSFVITEYQGVQKT